MPEQRFDIFFAGQLMDGADPVRVRSQVAKIFNASDEHLARLFSGRAVKIKGDVDQETAIKYRVAFRDAGALVEIRTADPLAAPSPSPAPPRAQDAIADEAADADPDNLELLPPRTGSLIDCAREIEPAPIPDVSNINLAAVGIDLDETPPPPPAQIDTSDLELNPPNSGTLEDCQIEKEPTPIPDISHIQLDENERE